MATSRRHRNEPARMERGPAYPELRLHHPDEASQSHDTCESEPLIGASSVSETSSAPHTVLGTDADIELCKDALELVREPAGLFSGDGTPLQLNRLFRSLMIACQRTWHDAWQRDLALHVERVMSSGEPQRCPLTLDMSTHSYGAELRPTGIAGARRVFMVLHRNVAYDHVGTRPLDVRGWFSWTGRLVGSDRAELHGILPDPLGGEGSPSIPWVLQLHDDDLARVGRALQRCHDHGDRVDVDARVWRSNQWRWHLFRNSQSPTGLLAGVAFDVDRLKLAEQQLMLTQQSIDRSRDFVFWFDCRGHLVYANDAACDRLELSRRSMHNVSFDSLFDSQSTTWGTNLSQDDWNQLWIALTRDGEWHNDTAWLRLPTGARVPVRVRGHRVTHGQEDLAFLWVEDLSTQRAVRRTLREKRTLLRLTQEVANLGVMRWQPRHGKLVLSGGLKRTLTTSEVGDARSMFRLVFRDDRRRFLDSLRTARSSTRPVPVDVRIHTDDGQVRFLTGALQVEDTTDLVVAVVQDITDRRQNEEKLQKHQRNLAHSTRLHTMGEMVAGIAHELAQPLCAISNFAAACHNSVRQVSGPGKELLSQWVESIQEEAQRSGKIIDRLRSYVRGTEPHRSTHDIRALVQSAVDMVEMEARSRNVDLRFPSSGPNATVLVDSVQIQQVLVNLLRNGFDAVDGSASGQVRITTGLTSTDVAVDIQDNGCGLNSDLETIFEPFMTSKADGMGMGLAISRTIVSWHDGKIWATRNADAPGLTFHVTIPRITKE